MNRRAGQTQEPTDATHRISIANVGQENPTWLPGNLRERRRISARLILSIEPMLDEGRLCKPPFAGLAGRQDAARSAMGRNSRPQGLGYSFAGPFLPIHSIRLRLN